MLVSTARVSHPARNAHARRLVRNEVFVPTAYFLVSSKHRHSCRGVRHCHWSYGQNDLHRETRRRHRVTRYRYMESVSRKLSWDNKNRPDHADIKAAMKAAMTQFGGPSNVKTGDQSKYTNIDELQSWSDDVSGVRPGRNIEDVEREAIEHLFRGDKATGYEYDLWKSPLKNIQNYLQTHRSPKEVTPEEVLHATTTADNGDSIDPITNRRVSKGASRSAPFTPKFEDLDEYVSAKDGKEATDAGKYGPVRWNEPDGLPDETPEEKSKRYEDLHKYSERNIDDPNAPRTLTPEEESKNYNDLDKYKPVQWNEPDGLPDLTPEEKSKQYEDLDKYSEKKFDDPFTPRKLTPEEQSKFYDDLDQYGPVKWNEPDGLRKLTPEEKSKEYDDLHKYGAVHWNEPDGLRTLTPEELSKNYDDLHKYGPVTWNEPDGLRKLTPEEESKFYDDLGTYRKRFVVEDAKLEAHESSATQLDTAPKGETLPPKVEIASEDPRKQYDDLDKYGPVRWNEPDGLRKLTPEEKSKAYEDLHLYGAVRWNEPDGLRKLTPEEESKNYEDLPAYVSAVGRGPEVIPFRLHPEEASKQYEDLPQYKNYDNGDAPPRVHPEEASKQYEDLHLYSKFTNNGPAKERVHPEEISKQYEDLSKYPRAGFTESGRISHIHPEELTKNYTDLPKYNPRTFDAADRSYPMHPEEATKAYEDLDAYTTGFEPSRRGQLGTDAASITPPSSARQFSTGIIDASSAGLGSASEIRAGVLRRAWDNSRKQKLEQSKVRDEATWDVTASDAKNTLKGKTLGGRKLTGNYSRDFPEEFATSWSTSYSPSKSTMYPKNGAPASSKASKASNVAAQSVEQEEAELGSMDESFPTKQTRLEPALSRQASKKPQEAKEQDEKPVWPVFVKHYNSETSKAANATEQQSKLDSAIKIITFDPMTKRISTVDATMAPHESAPIMSWNDAMLASHHQGEFNKFCIPLKKAGYMPFSSAGNVMMLRKDKIPSGASPAGQAINPVDLMGQTPVSGNFASPTGYVNYDTVPEDGHDKPEPPFRSNITVRREEPVFSGGKTYQQERPKRRLGKKILMGTVWVGGAAYAVGVLGEYFSTGGFDGIGPKGF